MIRTSTSLLLAVLWLTACATPRNPVAGLPRFSEEDRANLIIRYYCDDTSYVLKPETRDGPFLTVLKKDAVLALAKQQPDRQMAVVVLIHYKAGSQAEAVKQDWTNLLSGAGYRRIVFLHASTGMSVNGLPVLASRGQG
jgi:hypothetical protein